MTLTRNDVPIGSIGGTGNESSVGGALDKQDPPSTGSGSSSAGNGLSGVGIGNGGVSGNTSNQGSGASQVTQAVPTMTQDQARSALKQLSGEAYASNASVLLSQGDTVRTLSLDRLRGNLTRHARRTPDGPGRRRALFRRPAAKRRLSGLDTGRRQLEQVQGRRQRGEREPVVRRTFVGGDTETGKAGAWAARWAIWTAATRSPTARRAPRSTATRRPSSAAATSPPARASCASWPARLHLAQHRRQARCRGRHAEPATQVVLSRHVDAALHRTRLQAAAGRCLQHRTLRRPGLEPAAHARLQGVGQRRAERIGQHHDVASSTLACAAHGSLAPSAATA